MLHFVPKDYPAKFVVYEAMNILNRKFYIGMTTKGVHHRQKQHLAAARYGKKGGKFYNAIRKYGENNFWFYILAVCDDIDEALREEREFIKALKPEYNMTIGGEGTVGYKHNQETKRRNVESRRAKSGYKNTHRYKPVRCISDGRLFPSAVSAGRYYGFSRSMMTFLCKKERSSKSGLRFEYIKGDSNV